MTELAGHSVVYVNNFPGPHQGGGEVHLMHLVRGALGVGMHVIVVAQSGSGVAREARAAGCEVLETVMTLRTIHAVTNLVAEIARRSDAAVLHGAGYYQNLVVRRAGRRVPSKVVNTIHTEPRAVLGFRKGARAGLEQCLREAVDNRTFKDADAIVADSRAIADALVKQGIDPSLVSVIHNAVDVDEVRTEAADTEVPPAVAEARARGELLVGTVGRLETVKGLHDFLDAVPIVLSRVPTARFLLAGAGSLESELRVLINADAVLAGHVDLLGFVPSAVALIGALDVYCLPSRSEGFNTTILEAGGLSRAVVATDVGGAREAIEDGTNGLLVPSANPPALGAAIARALEDSTLRESMGRRLAETVERRFTVAAMVEAYLDLYRRLILAS